MKCLKVSIDLVPLQKAVEEHAFEPQAAFLKRRDVEPWLAVEKNVEVERVGLLQRTRRASSSQRRLAVDSGCWASVRPCGRRRVGSSPGQHYWGH